MIYKLADGVNVFQGYKTGVIRQMQDSWSPRLQGIHCFVSFFFSNFILYALSKLGVYKLLHYKEVTNE
jgi:hypothetical protein